MSENERQILFRDTLSLGKRITPEEALGLLKSIHNASDESVFRCFPELRGFTGEVKFEEVSYRRGPCIIMRGLEGDDQKWYDYIDLSSGNPITKVG